METIESSIWVATITGLPASRMKEVTRQTGLDCKVPANLAWRVLSTGADDFLSVPDDCIDPCIELLSNEELVGPGPIIAAGESAVAGLGALVASAAQPKLGEALGLNRTSRVALVVCEGAFGCGRGVA